jgi:xanthine dehydrogenase molybdopterin-binding subunit B
VRCFGAQIEGGFVQGMGWLCLEEMIWGDKVGVGVALRAQPVIARMPGCRAEPRMHGLALSAAHPADLLH